MKFNTRNVRNLIGTFSFALLSSMTFAQDAENLVPNGSFESTDKKPKRLGKIESATGWVSPTGVRADLFVKTKIAEIGTPANIYGSEDPKEGSNYAGIYGFSYGDKMPRSYVMTKFSTPLKKGMTYCVKFNMSLAEASKYASNNIGALIGRKIPGTDSKVSLIEEGAVVHLSNDYETFSGRYNWTEVCGVYTAKGGEKYIAIGNFSSNEDTKSVRMKKDPKNKEIKVSQIVAAYYYIDVVSVKLVDSDKGEKCDCVAGEVGDDYSTMVYQKVFTAKEDATPADRVNERQVFFAFGKSKLSAEGKKSLDLIAEILKENPDSKLRIMGHNNAEEDLVGEENDYYADVDNKRIASVMKYLMDKGIAESRLIPTRKGADAPNEQEASDLDDDEVKQAKNRRVTFILK